MILPKAPAAYDSQDEQRARHAITQEDKFNLKLNRLGDGVADLLAGPVSGIGNPSNRYTNFSAMASYADSNNSNYVNSGYGAAWVLTPSSVGRVKIRITGTLQESSAFGIAEIRGIYYGTGSAPSVGTAPVTGTRANGNSWVFSPGIAGAQTIFSIECEISGLSIGTQYWFDIGIGAVATGTATVRPSSVIIEEF
jgi:hypothetical protein